MDTFIKTFVICLVVTLGFLFYKFFGIDSHTKEITNVNKSVYSIQKDEKYAQKEPPKEEEKAEEVNKNKEEQTKKFHTCYFYTNQGKLIPVTREVNGSDPIKSAVLLLLKGPLISETKKGIYTEIPANVDLISIDSNDKRVIVNLTSNFGNGGGFDSVEHRVKQLSQTVKTAAPTKSVYLYINGKEVEYLGGDGVYIKQPLE